MNTDHAWDDEHPVRLAQRRIADAFARAIPGPKPGEAQGILSCLAPIAEAVGWQGTPRQIAEAMPHEMPVDDLTALRTVLYRIGIVTERAVLPAEAFRDDYCPYLLVTGPRSVILVTSLGFDGTAQIFDSATAQWRIAGLGELEGEALTVRLTDPQLRQEELQRDGFIWPLLRKSSSQLRRLFWQSFAINALGLVLSLYIMYVYDKAIGTKSVDTLSMLFVGGILAVAVEIWLRERRGANIARLGARFDSLASTETLQAVLGLPLTMSEGAPLSAQLTRFRQFQVGRELFGGSLAVSLLDLPFTLFFFAMMFVIGGNLAFIPVGFAAILAVTGLATSPAMSKTMRDMGEWKGKSESVLIDVCAKLAPIRADNAEDVWLRRATDSYRNYLLSKFDSQQFSNNLQVVAQAGVTITGALVLGLGSIQVMQGTLSLGAMVALMAVLWRVLGPVQTVFLSTHRLSAMVSTVQQIDKLVKMKREREPGRMLGQGVALSGRMSLSAVCFRYPNRSDLAIKGVSLEIGKGELVAVVGPSGAGKSTLLKVMLGLYQPQSGSVRLDDFDLRQVDTTEVRQMLSYLGQDPAMFYGTVAQNMRLVAPDASETELLQALAAVGIGKHDPALPDGLETRFNAKNRRAMSPPFVQRLALAQAFLRNSPIVFLDEPANHLDRAGDAALMHMISRLRGSRTIVMTTARPSHMKMADRVVVLNDGALMAQGKPQDILPALGIPMNRAG